MGCGASSSAGPPDSATDSAAPTKPEGKEAASKPAGAAAAAQAPSNQNQAAGDAAADAEPSARRAQGQRRKTQTRRRIAISAEISALGEVKKMVHPKDDTVKEQIRAALKAHPLFEYLQGELLESIVDCMEECKYAAKQTVIAQGDPGDHFYVVTAGELAAYIQAQGDDPVQEYRSGDSFGELALMYNSPRATTINALTDSIIYSLERRAFRHLVMDHNSKSKHGLEQYLSTVPVLAALEPDQRITLANAAEMVDYDDGEYIIQIGERADALYLILSGEVVCHRGDGSELMRLTTGRFFGESAVSEEPDAQRQANVVAVGPVRLAMLKASAFKQLMGSLQEVMNRNFNRKVLECVEILSPLDAADKDKLLDGLTEVQPPPPPPPPASLKHHPGMLTWSHGARYMRARSHEVCAERR